MLRGRTSKEAPGPSASRAGWLSWRPAPRSGLLRSLPPPAVDVRFGPQPPKEHTGDTETDDPDRPEVHRRAAAEREAECGHQHVGAADQTADCHRATHRGAALFTDAREAILVRAPALAQTLLLFFRQRLEPRQAFACVAIVEAQFRGAVDTCVGRWRKHRRRRSSFDEGLLVLSRCATERLRDRVSRRRLQLDAFAQRAERRFRERVGSRSSLRGLGGLLGRAHRRLRHRDLPRCFARSGLGLGREHRFLRQRRPVVVFVRRVRHEGLYRLPRDGRRGRGCKAPTSSGLCGALHAEDAVRRGQNFAPTVKMMPENVVSASKM